MRSDLGIGGARLPRAREIRDTLVGLLGRKVEVSPGDPFSGAVPGGAAFAVYVDERMRTRAVAVVDLALCARTGAAIGLVPVHAADAAVADGSLPDQLRENVVEVLNVLTSVLNDDRHVHVRLHAVHHVGDFLPNDVPAVAAVLGRRLDLEVDIAAYGDGRLSFVVLD